MILYYVLQTTHDTLSCWKSPGLLLNTVAVMGCIWSVTVFSHSNIHMNTVAQSFQQNVPLSITLLLPKPPVSTWVCVPWRTMTLSPGYWSSFVGPLIVVLTTAYWGVLSQLSDPCFVYHASRHYLQELTLHLLSNKSHLLTDVCNNKNNY